MSNSMDIYMEQVGKYPLIDREEEVRLGRAIQNGDRAARDKLINSNLRFVVKYSYKFKAYHNHGISTEDLIQRGNIGLMKAADKYDPERGFRFLSYAVWDIRAEMSRYIINNFNIIKMGTTDHERILFFNYRYVSEILNIADQNERQVAREKFVKNLKGVSLKNLLAYELKIEQMNKSIRLDDSAYKDKDTDMATYHELIGEDAKQVIDIENEVFNNKINEIIFRNSVLDDREMDVINSRFLKDEQEKLHEIGYRYGVSRERIRQIEKKALKKLKSYFDIYGHTMESLGLVA